MIDFFTDLLKGRYLCTQRVARILARRLVRGECANTPPDPSLNRSRARSKLRKYAFSVIADRLNALRCSCLLGGEDHE